MAFTSAETTFQGPTQSLDDRKQSRSGSDDGSSIAISESDRSGEARLPPVSAVCARCRGIHIETITATDGYHHSTLSELTKGADECALCHIMLGLIVRDDDRYTPDRYSLKISLNAETSVHLRGSGHFTDDMRPTVWGLSEDLGHSYRHDTLERV